jgi:hypothetical protein
MKNFFEKVKKEGSDIINLQNSREDDIDQCLKDWNRGKYDIYVGGVSLEQIYRDEGYTKLDTDNTIVPRDIIASELENIWKKYLLRGINSEERREDMLWHMSRYMHQGGYLNMLQVSINEMGMKPILEAIKNEHEELQESPLGFTVRDNNSERRMNFSVDGEKY